MRTIMRTLPSDRIGRRKVANFAAVAGSISPNTRSPPKVVASAESRAVEAAIAESQSRADTAREVPSTAAKRAEADTSVEDFESTAVFLQIGSLRGLASVVVVSLGVERTTDEGRVDWREAHVRLGAARWQSIRVH
mmetsp:Transcript_33698/g.73582  ORF Transcript_33698/g.73582 Transcript_33698/m.73582 type:complete len:136 (-) Transcript_33698:64-471(-)